MERFNLKQYLLYALLMIRTNTLVLWSLALIGSCSATALLVKNTPWFWPLNLLSILLSICATPVFYGIYYELIEDTYSSIGQIVKTYLLRYIWLLLRMYVPVIFLAGLPIALFPSAGIGGYFEVTLIAFSLVYIYVIPIFYLSGKQQGAISGGIKFLFLNLSASTPLIFTVLLLETVVLLAQQSKILAERTDSLTFALVDLMVYLSASIVDLAVFIILVFVLKNAGNNNPNEDAP